VKEGDLLTTSGIDGVYRPACRWRAWPAWTGSGSSFAHILCQPVAQLQGVTHVMVLTPMARAAQAATAASAPVPAPDTAAAPAPGPRQARGQAHRQSEGKGTPRRQASLRLEGARHDHAPRPAAAAAGAPLLHLGSAC
jgi:hypothetical protein